MRSSYFCTFVAVCLQLFNACALPEGLSQCRGETSRSPGQFVPGGRPVKLKEFPYLVLLELKGITVEMFNTSIVPTNTGSILSHTTVLSINLGEESDIVAYAGLVSTEDIEKKKDTVQIRHVTSRVEPKDNKHDIIIYRVDKSWEWSEFVASVSLDLSESSLEPSSVMSCKVMGFWPGMRPLVPVVAYVMDQKIGSALQCGLENEAGYLYSKDVKSKGIMFYVGGPAVCNGQQRGINLKDENLISAGETTDEPEGKLRTQNICNIYIDITYYRDWFRENSADSLHCCLKQFSMYKVLLYPSLWLFFL